MSRAHMMTAWAPFGLEPDALEVLITYVFSPGRPAVMYLRNGDPGYPADPAEVDFRAVKVADKTLILPSNLQKALDDWAVEYLANDAGYAAALEVAASDHEAAREYAAELRADR